MKALRSGRLFLLAKSGLESFRALGTAKEVIRSSGFLKIASFIGRMEPFGKILSADV